MIKTIVANFLMPFDSIFSKKISCWPKQIIGVTGTNGKTSTVEFCRQLWSHAGWKAASMGTLGTRTETSVNTGIYKKSNYNAR